MAHPVIDPYRPVRDLERAVADYCNAPYCIATTSCTMALLLAVAWELRDDQYQDGMRIEIPSRTYVSVPMSIKHAGGRPVFRDEEWRGAYQLKPLPIWDAARRFTQGMFRATARLGAQEEPSPPPDHAFVCVSFHTTKILGHTQGGAILHDSRDADAWLRRARFDGRTEGVDPKNDEFLHLGWHAPMSPDVAATLLLRLSVLPRHNPDLPNSDYADLSQCPLFKT